jgi:hypothetical protein
MPRAPYPVVPELSELCLFAAIERGPAAEEGSNPPLAYVEALLDASLSAKPARDTH